MNRVVITGRGAVSPFGLGVNALVESVWAGKSGVKIIEAWRKIDGMHSFLAAPVPEIDTKSLLPRSQRRTMGDMAIYSTLAAKEAINDAGLSEEFVSSGDLGLAIGATTGSPANYEDFYREFINNNSIAAIRSGMFFKIMGHSCAANVALALGINGEQWSPVSACTSSAQAMGLGYMLIKSGRQKAVICGGADETHSTVTMVFDVVKAASLKNDTPQLTPRPFDKDRDGVVCGGGAGVLVLESLESATVRGADIYCEILGFGHVNDSSHIANPHQDSMARAIKQAMNEAGVDKDDIDYVNAHATGTQQGDIAEAKAIAMAVNNQAPVSSFKGHLGHTLAAAGGLESVLLLEMMHRQEVVPTLHLDNPDPECACVNLARKQAALEINTVIKNNFALGGVNAALVLRRWT